MVNQREVEDANFSNSVNLWNSLSRHYVDQMRKAGGEEDSKGMQESGLQAIAFATVAQTELALIAQQQRDEIIRLLSYIADEVYESTSRHLSPQERIRAVSKRARPGKTVKPPDANTK